MTFDTSLPGVHEVLVRRSILQKADAGWDCCSCLSQYYSVSRVQKCPLSLTVTNHVRRHSRTRNSAHSQLAAWLQRMVEVVRGRRRTKYVMSWLLCVSESFTTWFILSDVKTPYKTAWLRQCEAELSIDTRITRTKWKPENRLTLNMVNWARTEVDVKKTGTESRVSQHRDPLGIKQTLTLTLYHTWRLIISRSTVHKGKRQHQEKSDLLLGGTA